eukprot:SAG11_NODE_604_length_8248_cov_6.574251_8_plen_68_part_00
MTRIPDYLVYRLDLTPAGDQMGAAAKLEVVARLGQNRPMEIHPVFSVCPARPTETGTIYQVRCIRIY